MAVFGQVLRLHILREIFTIYTTLRDNHPGMHNKDDPDFLTFLEDTNQQAQEALKDILTEKEGRVVLESFVEGFQDKHLRLMWKNAQKVSSVSVPSSKFLVQDDGKMVYIRLPHFAPSSPDQVRQLTTIIDDMPTYRKRTIVFDVRGNGGGNSTWGSKLLANLFTPNYFYLMRERVLAQETVIWRCSKANVEFLQKNLSVIMQGLPEDEQGYWRSLLRGLRLAYEKGHLLYEEKKDVPAVCSSSLPHPVTATVVVLIDSGCFSACLDFLDELKMMDYPNLIFVGMPTGSDTIYMDVHTVDLPSGQGSLGFPMKMYRNRPRGHNEPHLPDVRRPWDREGGSLSQDIALVSSLLEK